MKKACCFLLFFPWLALSLLSVLLVLLGIFFEAVGTIFRKASWRLGTVANMVEIWGERGES